MANRVFQNVVYQMKDAVDRVVGVVDETGTVISCSELGQIGEVREGVAAARQTAGDAFVRDGYAYHQFSNAKHNDYAVICRGHRRTRPSSSAAMLSISLQSIKQYHDEKFDKTNFIKNVVLDNILPGDIYAKARELHFVSDVQRVVLLIRVTSGNDISAYDVVSGLFPDKQKDFVFNISETDTVLVKEIKPDNNTRDMEKLAASIVDTLQGDHYIKAVVGIGTPIGNIKDLASSFKEAQIAMEVGKVFDTEQPGHQLRPSGHCPPDLPAAHDAVRDFPDARCSSRRCIDSLDARDAVHHPALLREQPERLRDEPRAVRPPQHAGLPSGEDQEAHRPGSAGV